MDEWLEKIDANALAIAIVFALIIGACVFSGFSFLEHQASGRSANGHKERVDSEKRLTTKLDALGTQMKDLHTCKAN